MAASPIEGVRKQYVCKIKYTKIYSLIQRQRTVIAPVVLMMQKHLGGTDVIHSVHALNI